MNSAGEKTTGNVPAFLMKVWTLVEDPATDELIYWDPSGTSFHVYDQQRFSREILPLFFKHSNIASFIRQLNMYGFRKVAHIDQGSLKIENDDLHFQHQYFQRGERDLLQHIKRKVSNQTMRADTLSAVKNDEVSRVLADVTHMKSKQEDVDHKLEYIKRENKLLWREVATLRQKHHKQQEIVNKLIQFLVSLVSSNRSGLSIPALRRGPLAIDSSQLTTTTPMPNNVPDNGQQILNTNTTSNYTIESPKSVDLQPVTPNLSTGLIIHELPEVLESPEQNAIFSENLNVGASPGSFTADSPRKKDTFTTAQYKSPQVIVSQQPAVNTQTLNFLDTNSSSPSSSTSSSLPKISTAPSLQDALNYAWANLDTPTTTQDPSLNRRKRSKQLSLSSGDASPPKKSTGWQSSSYAPMEDLVTPDIDQANSTLDQLVMSNSALDNNKTAEAKGDATLALPNFNSGEDISIINSNQLDFLNSDLDGLRGLLQEQYKIDPSILVDLFETSNPWSIIPEKINEEGIHDKEDEPGTSSYDSSNGDVTGTEVVQYNPRELFPELLDDNVIDDIDDLD